MSDRSPEDELIAEAVKFGRSFTYMLRAHAQAGNWLERRRIRKQISIALREQRHAEETAREHQLAWTQRMVEHYRAHSLAVAERATDPSVDHERRYRDARALNRHAEDLRSRVIAARRLTPIEQGIALDGVDAATTFPEFKTGELFARAHKVKGVEALRYRAQVARATRQQPYPEHDERLAEHALQWQSVFGDPQRSGQPAHQDVSTGPEKPLRPFEAVVGPTEVFRPSSSPARTSSENWFRWGRFQTREDAYDWMLGELARQSQTTSRRGEDFTATVNEEGRPHSSEIAEGPIGMVTDEVRTWREQRTRTTPAPAAAQARPASPPHPDAPDTRMEQVERQLANMAADRDRLGSRVEILQRGLDAVTADRDEIRRKLGNAESQIESLKNRNQRMAAEISELRDRPNVDVVAAERDRYKRERDEAVFKLAQQTPLKDRYGSGERTDYDRLGDTQRHPRPSRADAEDPDCVQRNGLGRNGTERSR